MIIQLPYKYTPGLSALCGDPRPMKQEEINTYDEPQNIIRCLNCTIPPEECSGTCEAEPRSGREGPGRPQKAPVERVAQMVRDGWTDKAICRELGISKSTLMGKKTECRKIGLLA